MNNTRQPNCADIGTISRRSRNVPSIPVKPRQQTQALRDRSLLSGGRGRRFKSSHSDQHLARFPEAVRKKIRKKIRLT
jgi:hypothetical protein